MNNKKQKLFTIAGCNGAGKTTASFSLLPNILDCNEFINADEIAKGISPFQPEKVAFESGRIMLNRINDLLRAKISFAFETTLASKSYKGKIQFAKNHGYEIILLFFWLNNVNLAKKRVYSRVLEGGHNIPNETIIRRYYSGIKNLFKIYLPLVDEALIFDNSHGKHELIAQKAGSTELNIFNSLKFENLKKSYE